MQINLLKPTFAETKIYKLSNGKYIEFIIINLKSYQKFLAHLSPKIKMSYCLSSIINKCFKAHLLNYWLDFVQTW